MTTARLVLMLGTYATGGRPVGVLEDSARTLQVSSVPTGAALTIDGRAVGTTPATGTLSAKIVEPERMTSPLKQWDRRRNRLYLPDVEPAAWVWAHERRPLPLASVEPNQPETGDTRVTLGFNAAIPRKVGNIVRVAFSLTGLADLDDVDHLLCEVTDQGSASTPAVLVIRDFVASGSATFGLASIGFIDLYSSERNAHTDASHGGAWPSVVFGAEASLLAHLEDRLTVSDPGDPIILLQIGSNAEGLRGRISDQGGRWAADLEDASLVADGTGSLPKGADLTQFAELRSLLRDVVEYLEGGYGILPANVEIEALVLGHGLHDATMSDPDGSSRLLTVSSFTLDGSDLLVTTTAAHLVPEKASAKAWQIAMLSGLTTDPDDVGGRKVEVERVSDTQLRIRGIEATDVPTFTAGTATIDVRAPAWWFESDLLEHIDDVRALCASMTATEADDIRTVLIEPSRYVKNATDTQIRNVMERVPGRRANVTLVDLDDLDRTNDARFLYTEVGKLAASTITISKVGTVWHISRPAGGFATWRPGWHVQVVFSAAPGVLFRAVIAAVLSDTEFTCTNGSGGAYFLEDGVTQWPVSLIAGSATGTIARMVRDVSNVFFSTFGMLELGDAIASELVAPTAPAVLTARRPVICVAMIGDSYGVGQAVTTHFVDGDPRVLSNPADPMDGVFVWNQNTQAIEDAKCWVDLATGVVSGNLNTHPEWNYAQLVPGLQTVGPQMAFLRAMRERCPDSFVGLLNLGVNGATLAVASDGLNAVAISTVILQPGFALVQMASGGTPFNRALSVTIAGVTGLTPSINGTHTDAEPLFLGTGGTTTWIRIPGTFTGTANVSAATISVRNPSWKPSAGEVFASFEEQAKAFTQALLDAGYYPDFRLVVSLLGLNDARVGSHAGVPDALAELVPAVRGLLETRALPREFAELPWVQLAPIVHAGLSSGTLANMAEVRAAFAAFAASDPSFGVLTLDQSEDWLLDYATISLDAVHPTGKGSREIGYRLARVGADAITGWTGRYPVDLTPAAPVGDVTP